jgi:predicted TIM-barrel fold metal-dependent hydrolase
VTVEAQKAASTAPRRLVAGDVHSHVWLREHLSDDFVADLLRAWPEAASVAAGYEEHAQHALDAERTVVLAFDAPHVGFEVPDEYVARYVARDEHRLVGFCSIDPVRRNVRDKLARAVEELGLRGVKLAPTYQGFDPLGPEAAALYEVVAERRLPVVWHQGVTFVRKSILAYAFPRQIDDVALRFPEIPIVIAHLGHPWIDECIAVVRKHPSVYADISALISRPVQMRAALISAGEYRVHDKLLFGTDYPFATSRATVAVLEGWLEDPDSPDVLRETVVAILKSSPLETLGL